MVSCRKAKPAKSQANPHVSQSETPRYKILARLPAVAACQCRLRDSLRQLQSKSRKDTGRKKTRVLTRQARQGSQGSTRLLSPSSSRSRACLRCRAGGVFLFLAVARRGIHPLISTVLLVPIAPELSLFFCPSGLALAPARSIQLLHRSLPVYCRSQRPRSRRP